ncbi:MAG: AAA family ATPase [Planctomycetes bacterium]|nr:AAA family ATPase [Planctomycetota bacterium]
MSMLRRLVLKGFKSIKAMDLELRPLNVLIGENGAGKSNLVSFFKLLQEMMAGRLQQFIGANGYAHSLLYFGPKLTPQMDAQLRFEVENGDVTYAIQLTHGAEDLLFFSHESLTFVPNDHGKLKFMPLGSGHKETRIRRPTKERERLRLRRLLDRCRMYHFHDTSPTARVRQSCFIRDNRALLPDAGNLAAILLDLQNYNHTAYRRLISTIRQIAPFFHDFALKVGTGDQETFLDWREMGSDSVFGPHQLSDGTLRAICLLTLLLQPEDSRWPDLIVVDEPELGLHPYALDIIASLFKKVSHHTQVIISTQSRGLVDHFDAQDIVVVDREGNGPSTFTRLEPERLAPWLEDYSLGEVWEKNVIGGGPH